MGCMCKCSVTCKLVLDMVSFLINRRNLNQRGRSPKSDTLVLAGLQEYIPHEQLSQVKRVLYGANQGKPAAAIDLPENVQKSAHAHNFDLQAYRFTAAAEQFRAPRIVRIGLIQNAVVRPTTAPFSEQRQVRVFPVYCDVLHTAVVCSNPGEPVCQHRVQKLHGCFLPVVSETKSAMCTAGSYQPCRLVSFVCAGNL